MIKKVFNNFPDVVVVIPGHGNYGGPVLFQHSLTLIENVHIK